VAEYNRFENLLEIRQKVKYILIIPSVKLKEDKLKNMGYWRMKAVKKNMKKKEISTKYLLL
jgi:hypothetical protein